MSFRKFAVLVPALVSVPSFAGPLNLICNGGGNKYRAMTTMYEKVIITTTSGPRQIYAPTEVTFTHSFVPATVPAGEKGQNLKAGECGLATGLLQGVSTNPTNPPTLKYKNFNQYYSSVYTFNAPGATSPTTSVSGQMFLPVCSTNVFAFAATQQPNPNMFEVVGDAAVTCLK